MSRIYAVPFTGTLTTAGGNTDIWSFAPVANRSINLRGFTLGQTTEVGDLAEENVRVTVIRLPATFTVGSGGSAVTAVATPGSSLDTVWGTSVRTNDTTVATTSGTAQILDEFGWNIRNAPYEHWYPDERFCPGAFNGQGLVIRLESTLVDDITFSGTAWFQEEG
jgi:hypothetical protein